MSCWDRSVQSGNNDETVEKVLWTFSTKELRPAASHLPPTCGGRLARLRAEKSFSRRTCRREKRISLDFAAAAAKRYEVF